MVLQFLAVGHSGGGAAASWGPCTELGQFMAWVTAQSGHGRGKAKPKLGWYRQNTSARAGQQQQQLLSFAHSGSWQESSLIMPQLSLHQDCLDQPKAGGKQEQPQVSFSTISTLQKWESRHSSDLSVQLLQV